MNNFENKIEARHRNLFDVLNEQKYTVDYFQREYSWGKKHIEALIVDLSLPFEPHATFKKEDIDKRQKLYQVICEKIWDCNLKE